MVSANGWKTRDRTEGRLCDYARTTTADYRTGDRRYAGFISGEIQDYESNQYGMAVGPNAAKLPTPRQGPERSKNSRAATLPSAAVLTPRLR
jgi:hypothetical protein